MSHGILAGVRPLLHMSIPRYHVLNAPSRNRPHTSRHALNMFFNALLSTAMCSFKDFQVSWVPSHSNAS